MLREWHSIAIIAFACRGTLVDWAGAIEAVAYELARRNGESPLDRGVGMRRRVEALATTRPGGRGLAFAFERLAHERGWVTEESGEESLSRAIFMTRLFPDVPDVVEAVSRSVRLVAMARADRRLVEGALRPLDGAFEEIITPSELPTYPLGQRPLYVSTSLHSLRRARALGMETAWLNRRGLLAPDDSPMPHYEWRSLRQLGLAPLRLAPVAA
jgi:FMN phosphatase YigB (HAD superfamily)